MRAFLLTGWLLVGLLTSVHAQTAKFDVPLSTYGLKNINVFPVQVDGMAAWLLLHETGQFQVARMHPERSGYMGWLPSPGLCMERYWYLPMSGWWWIVGGAPKDADGDGNDDLTLQSIDGSNRIAQVGLRLEKCGR